MIEKNIFNRNFLLYFTILKILSFSDRITIWIDLRTLGITHKKIFLFFVFFGLKTQKKHKMLTIKFFFDPICFEGLPAIMVLFLFSNFRRTRTVLHRILSYQTQTVPNYFCKKS